VKKNPITCHVQQDLACIEDKYYILPNHAGPVVLFWQKKKNKFKKKEKRGENNFIPIIWAS
jgi:hypothetical protein